MIAIVDYGVGNLLSVQKALESLGAQVYLARTPEDLAKAKAVILPGVGAFGRAMENLELRGLVPAIKASIASGKEFLGICLGMQLLLESSQEAPGTQGLGIIPGTVVRLQGQKVPQIGWNSLKFERPSPLFPGIDPEPYLYFVHSYCVAPEADVVAATTDYQGRFPSALWQDNIHALQFHPEKSGRVGLEILNNFWKLVQKCS